MAVISMVFPSCQCETLGHGSNRKGINLAEQGTFMASDYVEIWWRFRFSFDHGIEMKVCFDPFHTCVNTSCFPCKHHKCIQVLSGLKIYASSILPPKYLTRMFIGFFVSSDIFPHLRDFDVNFCPWHHAPPCIARRSMVCNKDPPHCLVVYVTLVM